MKKEITIEMDGKRYPATIDMPNEQWEPEPFERYYFSRNARSGVCRN